MARFRLPRLSGPRNSLLWSGPRGWTQRSCEDTDRGSASPPLFGPVQGKKRNKPSPRGERFSQKNSQFRGGLGRNDDAIKIKRNVCVVGGYSVYDGSEYASRGRERVQTYGPEVPVFA